LGELPPLVALCAAPDQSCAEVDQIARWRLSEVDRRIEQLIITFLRAELQRMVDACGDGRVGECRVIETFADHSRSEHNHLLNFAR
jgi:hypothetical protein